MPAGCWGRTSFALAQRSTAFPPVDSRSFNGLAPLAVFVCQLQSVAARKRADIAVLFLQPGNSFSGCDPNIADYPFTGAYVGNGQGYSTELPASAILPAACSILALKLTRAIPGRSNPTSP